MDFNIFNNKLKSSLQEAIEYKNEFIPNNLYKYVPLFDDKYVDYDKENNKRLDSLRNNKIWVSHYKYLNDPFELKMLAVDKETLKSTGWKLREIERYLELLRDPILISCFSADVDNNMPMWAHYANNHKGYCIKYSIIDYKSIFPVIYEPKRFKSAVIITNIINEILKGYTNELKTPTDKLVEYFSYLYFSFTCKHDMWKYENEYRVLDINLDLNISNGKLIKISDIGLKVEAIYIGYNCDEIYQDKLIKIGKDIGCKVYKMTFDEYGEEFKLEYEQVINR